jgi:alginate O-acetyltransferase complex protein AlgI
MLFNSAEYLFVFLPIVLLVFILLSTKKYAFAQIAWLLLTSAVFYASWDPIYLSLIVASILFNYLAGKWIESSDGNNRIPLIAGICANVGILAYFKYAGFFVENLNVIGDWLIPVPEITLPLAISFFTFQQIAYLVDVSKSKCKAYSLHEYSLFVMFFPQLIAGPIVHHSEMMPQFSVRRGRNAVIPDITVGLSIIVIGLFKKVVMADSLGFWVDPIFHSASLGQAVSTLDAWVATLGFSFQIYFDFSGYSDIAIGSARLFGIRLPENFHSPYRAKSVIDVWKRWHITLSRFLQEYVYVSLGGNRRGKLWRYNNLMITMLIGGLWHGAAWTYVIWGGLHGLYLWINHSWRFFKIRLNIEQYCDHKIFTPFYIAITFLAWAIALVVFRSNDLASALNIITPVASLTNSNTFYILGSGVGENSLRSLLVAIGLSPNSYFPVYILLSSSAFICWFLPNTQTYMARFKPVIISQKSEDQHFNFEWKATKQQAVVMGVLASVALLSLSAVDEFIYFQF